MDSESVGYVVGGIVVAIMGGTGIYSLCRYVLGPCVGHGNSEAIQRVAEAHEKCLTKVMGERARMAIELARNGRTPQDISACLEAALPFPESLDPKENAATDNN